MALRHGTVSAHRLYFRNILLAEVRLQATGYRLQGEKLMIFQGDFIFLGFALGLRYRVIETQYPIFVVNKENTSKG
jgi:hypothetical protein